MSYFRENIEKMTGYVPGEQPEQGRQVVKLNTNENPYPPSPAAMEILHSLGGESLRRYPAPMADRFGRAAGKVLDVPADWILPGNGSDDVLSMIFKACCCRGRPAVYPTPTYAYYRTLAQIQDAERVEVPFDEDYNLPVDALAEAEGAATFVSNPNSPSATFAPVELIGRLAARLKKGLLVIDEAYVDFAEDNCLGLVAKHPNVIVLRTLSKGYSLAGLRLGFAVAQPALLAELTKVKDHYNVDAVSCAVAAAAFEDQEHMKANAAKIKSSRAELAADLSDLGFRVWPSQANFLLVRPPGGDAKGVYLGLKARGVLVRYLDQPPIPVLADKLRVTVGTGEQNLAVVAALRELTCD